MLKPSRVLLAAVLTAAMSACSGEPAPEKVDASAVNAAMAAVADARQAVDAQVDPAQRVAVRMPDVAAALRSPSSVDETLETVAPLAAAAESVDPATFVTRLDALDAALADAGVALTRTAADLEAGSWEANFVSAQSGVVVALEAWSAATRTTAGVIAGHWDVYASTAAAAAVLDENRWRYRSREEAAATWEIEIRDDLDALAAAAAALEPALPAREQAAAAVIEADEHAAAVFSARPTTP